MPGSFFGLDQELDKSGNTVLVFQTHSEPTVSQASD